jgi:hypothetical protein
LAISDRVCGSCTVLINRRTVRADIGHDSEPIFLGWYRENFSSKNCNRRGRHEMTHRRRFALQIHFGISNPASIFG